MHSEARRLVGRSRPRSVEKRATFVVNPSPPAGWAWVYLLLTDFDPEAYAEVMHASVPGEDDVNTLGMFRAVGLRQAYGTPKPALATWDGFRQGNP
ncbi:MAG: hypothetical protein AB1449_15315 [Chloroflexota bacterium]